MSGTVVLIEKRCTKCDTVKPLSEFHRNRNTADGRGVWCKPVRDARQASSPISWRAAAWRPLSGATVSGTGNAYGKAYARDRSAALEALKARHPREFEHLLTLARRGELEAMT